MLNQDSARCSSQKKKAELAVRSMEAPATGSTRGEDMEAYGLESLLDAVNRCASLFASVVLLRFICALFAILSAVKQL